MLTLRRMANDMPTADSLHLFDQALFARLARGLTTLVMLVSIAKPALGQSDEPPASDETNATPGTVGAQAIPSIPLVTVTARTTIDRTLGQRSDTFTTATIGSDGTRYLGTLEGRVYVSSASGQLWRELTVLPEVKQLFGFSSQTALLGHIRNDGSRPARPLNLTPRLGLYPTHAYQSLSMLHGSIALANIESNVSTARTVKRANDLALSRPVGWGGQTIYENPLDRTTAAILEPGKAAISAGLSARAPRLSLLQRAWRRPIAAINLAKFLRGRARRTRISRIAINPVDKNHLFAATQYGLFESIDSGESWFRSFPGTTKQETDIREIVFDPHHTEPGKQRVYLGSGRGLFFSLDGGLSFTKHGFVPEVAINRVAFDPIDPNFIYVATRSGLYRSVDGGDTFSLAFFSSLRKQRQINWVDVDPNARETVYLATNDGAFVSTKARSQSSTGWSPLANMRLLNLAIYQIHSCRGYPGRLYARTSAALPTNLYFGYSPEGYVLESRDSGTNWSVSASTRSRGQFNWFSLNPNDCENFIALSSNAVTEVQRTKDTKDREEAPEALPAAPDLPDIGAVIAAAMKHGGVELEEYTDRVRALRTARWLPNTVNATLVWGRTRVGGVIDDFQFSDERFRSGEEFSELRIMAWASFALPDTLFEPGALPLYRSRVKLMNDAIRNRLMRTVYRHYRELLALTTEATTAKAKASPLAERAQKRALAQQHFAVVDLATGGFLTQWKKRRKSK